ncbi:rRNA-processing protein las1 [Neocucurbitaria cava]|uniref:rRNA-processing protein las1 n=1 Tax=Neocucurbitaria cava TaxID=798079 RepID=A0A9W9CHC9_9PLEO|nr:rRNA-processing protein las1 [Neocucurbitaria cava]
MAQRESAVNKVLAWRMRKPDGLPLLLDSTADIVDVVLQDERGGLKHNAMRLLYATAISRFVTGLADTQIELTRDRPAWFPPGKSLQLPLGLLETRHRIVHRHLPSLAELKRAAQDSLDWLWEWYWSQLDHAFSIAKSGDEEGVEPQEAPREKLNAVLKTYVKERKNEIKTRKKDPKAADNALSTYKLRFAPSRPSTSTPPLRIQRLLLQLLVDDKMILPTDKKLGSSMSGAYLIWSPFLLPFCTSTPSYLPILTLLNQIISAMNTPSTSRGMVHVELDPIREGLSDWAVQILTSAEWRSARGLTTNNLLEDTLTRCFSEPTFWNLRTAEKVLESGDIRYKEAWSAVLSAAKSGGGGGGGGEEMDVDVDDDGKGEKREIVIGEVKKGEKEKGGVTKEKIRGPTKVLGMWKPRPIGWLPPGWEDDE